MRDTERTTADGASWKRSNVNLFEEGRSYMREYLR